MRGGKFDADHARALVAEAISRIAPEFEMTAADVELTVGERPEWWAENAWALTCTRPKGEGAWALIMVRSDINPSEIDHIIRHELVHAATAERLEQLGEPKDDDQEREWLIAQLEYLTDQVALLMPEAACTAIESPPIGTCQHCNGKWYAAEDIDRMTRELDVAMNGADAAPQAMLIDIMDELLKRIVESPREATDAQLDAMGKEDCCFWPVFAEDQRERRRAHYRKLLAAAFPVAREGEKRQTPITDEAIICAFFDNPDACENLPPSYDDHAAAERIRALFSESAPPAQNEGGR